MKSRAARYLRAVRNFDRALTPSTTPPTIREETGPVAPLQMDLFKYMGPSVVSRGRSKPRRPKA